MNLNFNLEIKENELENFLRMIGRGHKFLTKRMMQSSGLIWKRYWELPSKTAKKYFILACLWADILPTSKMIREILVKDKGLGARNALLDVKWYWPSAYQKILKQAVLALSLDEFQKAWSRSGTNWRLINLASRQQLLLLMADPSIWVQNQVEKRLKGEEL